MAVINSETTERLTLFNRLVDSYRKTRDENILLDLQRQAQILNVMVTEPVFSEKCPLTKEFYFSVKYLLKHGQSSPLLVWNLISFLQNITQEPGVQNLIRCTLDMLPSLVDYLTDKTTEEKSASLLVLISRLLVPADTISGCYVEPLVKFLISGIMTTENHLNKLQFLVHLCSMSQGAIFHVRQFPYKNLFKVLFANTEQSTGYKLLSNMLLMQIDFGALWSPENYLPHLFQAMMKGVDKVPVKVAFEAFIKLCEHDLNHFLDKYEKYPEFFDLIYDHFDSSDLDDSELCLILQLVTLILKHVDKRKVTEKLPKLFQFGINASTRILIAPVALELCAHIQEMYGREHIEKIMLPLNLDIFTTHLNKLCSCWLNASISVEEEQHLTSLLRIKLLISMHGADSEGVLDLLTNMMEKILETQDPLKASTHELLSSLLLILNKKLPAEPPKDLIKKFLQHPSCQSMLGGYLGGKCGKLEYSQLFSIFIENDCSDVLACITYKAEPCLPQTKWKTCDAIEGEQVLNEVNHILSKLNLTHQLISLYEFRMSHLRREIMNLKHLLVESSSQVRNYQDELRLSEFQRERFMMSSNELLRQVQSNSGKKFSELETKVHELLKISSSLQEDLGNTKAKLVEKENTVCHLEQNLRETHQHIDDLKLAETKLKNVIIEKQNELGALSKVKETLDMENCKLKKSLNELKLLSQSQEDSLNNKEKEIQKLSKDLLELNRMREMIYEISAGKASRK